jgi:hypothetical protein
VRSSLTLLTCLTLVLGASALQLGCGERGFFERLGRKTDRTIKKAGDAVDDAADQAKDKAEEVSDAARDAGAKAAETVKEEAEKAEKQLKR